MDFYRSPIVFFKILIGKAVAVFDIVYVLKIVA